MRCFSLLLAVIVLALGGEFARGQGPLDALLKAGEAMEKQGQEKPRQFRDRIPDKGVITLSEKDYQEFIRGGDLNFDDATTTITAVAPDDAKRKIARWEALHASMQPGEEAEILRHLEQRDDPSVSRRVPLEGYEAIALKEFFQGDANEDNISINLLPLVVRGIEKCRLTILAPQGKQPKAGVKIDMTPANQKGLDELDAILLATEVPSFRDAIAIEKDFNRRESDRDLPFEVRESAEKYVKYRAEEQPSLDPADLENSVHAVDWFFRNRAKEFAKQQREEQQAALAAAAAEAKRRPLKAMLFPPEVAPTPTIGSEPTESEFAEPVAESTSLITWLVGGVAGAVMLTSAGFIYWRRGASKRLVTRHRELHPNVSQEVNEPHYEVPKSSRADAVDSPFV